MKCGNCDISVIILPDGFPMSHYWKGTPEKVEVPFCGTSCSLQYYERTKDD